MNSLCWFDQRQHNTTWWFGSVTVWFGSTRVCFGISPNVLISLSLGLDQAEYVLWSKTHKRLKELFLIGRNRIKRANFRGIPIFQATYNIKTEKQTIQLILCQLDARRRVEGKGKETDWSICLISARMPCDRLFRSLCERLFRSLCDRLFRSLCDRLFRSLCNRLFRSLCDGLFRSLCDRLFRSLCDRLFRSLCDRLFRSLCDILFRSLW